MTEERLVGLRGDERRGAAGPEGCGVRTAQSRGLQTAEGKKRNRSEHAISLLNLDQSYYGLVGSEWNRRRSGTNDESHSRYHFYSARLFRDKTGVSGISWIDPTAAGIRGGQHPAIG